MAKFQYGDIVIGNAEASKNYTTTITGTKWIVVSDNSDRRLSGRIEIIRFSTSSLKAYEEGRIRANDRFDVSDKCFDLVVLDNESFVDRLPKVDWDNTLKGMEE